MFYFAYEFQIEEVKVKNYHAFWMLTILLQFSNLADLLSP